MPDWNQQLFLLINASAYPNAWLVQIASILAASPVMVGPVVLVAFWVWGAPACRGALLAVAGAVLVGQGINQIVGLLYFEPRPFMIGLGHTLIPHVPDNSFPSDHATFVWTVGAGLIATGAGRRCGVAICLYGLTVAWSRVFLSVHFPDDMAASAVVAVVGAGLARIGQPVAAVWLLPLADRLYEASLPTLRLPPALVPRQPRQRQTVR